MNGQVKGEAVRIRPIRKIRAYEEIVRQVRSFIERQELRPGDRLLSERELAEQFQVSRVTVRQALSVLQAMGLIESRVGNGTFARESQSPTVTVLASMLNPPRSTLLEQLELRRLIEPEVARLAARRASEGHIQELERYLDLQRRKLQDRLPVIDEDSALHLAIARSSGNDLLVRMIESIHELLRGSREESFRTGKALERSLVSHQRIVEAIGKHDELAAYRAMRRHVLSVEASITKSHHNHHDM